jgi:hypothetical protein
LLALLDTIRHPSNFASYAPNRSDVALN